MTKMELFTSEGSSPRGGAPAPRRISLVRLSSEIARSVAAVGRVTVEGEVVEPRIRGSRIYFTLRDRATQVSVTCPASRARRCRAVHGERVSVTATVEYAANRGRISLVAEEVVPVGEGAIAAAIADVRQRLSADGLLERARRPIPRLPAAIGVVCGGNAAVRADIESVVDARFPGYPTVFAEVNVSGPGAAESIIDALRRLDARPDVEVVIVARGGGDAAELLPFSDEGLCRTVAASTTPVVSAVGHHGDNPLCDEVADLRCGTPSLAASAIVPDRARLEGEVDRLRQDVRSGAEVALANGGARLRSADPTDALASGLALSASRLDRASVQLARVDVPGRVAMLGERLARLDWTSPLARRTSAAEEALRAGRRTLDALDPQQVLSRGYAVVRDASGSVVRDPAQVGAGDALELTVARGRIDAVVAEQDSVSGSGWEAEAPAQRERGQGTRR